MNTIMRKSVLSVAGLAFAGGDVGPFGVDAAHPAATPASCQALTCSSLSQLKPMVMPLPLVAGCPSIGGETMNTLPLCRQAARPLSSTPPGFGYQGLALRKALEELGFEHVAAGPLVPTAAAARRTAAGWAARTRVRERPW